MSNTLEKLLNRRDIHFKHLGEAFDEACGPPLPPRGSRPPGARAGACACACARRAPRHFLRLCAPRLHARRLRAARLERLAHALHRPPRPPLPHGLPAVLPAPAAARLPGVAAYQRASPSEATECFAAEKIWLAPPQFYEIRRVENFASLSDLRKFCLDRALEGTERWLPITLLTADGRLQLLPGMSYQALGVTEDRGVTAGGGEADPGVCSSQRQSDSARSKMLTGVGDFVLGLIRLMGSRTDLKHTRSLGTSTSHTSVVQQPPTSKKDIMTELCP
ncbi:hypothetical protein HPG69_018133 [Diceros bicornis minor]|uniref:Uncharacterized protein n=1 Tax=Diceros bicornis minor TaxID=77932 RepID=A0A7J7EJ75_DICBM|nr:hypothetical protein HPG69_018133 [Diceros bicornis minor]